MAYSANSTTLSYLDKTTEEFKLINLLMEVPEFDSGAPEKIDVTTLSDKTKQYIPGIKDYGDLVFKFLYESGDEGDYNILKTMEEDYDLGNGSADFKLEYPDGSAHLFNAIPYVKMDAGAINGALTFSATMILEGDIEAA